MTNVRSVLCPLVLLCVSMTGCASQAPAKHGSIAEYPGALHPPSSYPNLFVEQHVAVRFQGRTGGFDAVVQKRADELLLIGLGPLGVRAFVLRQDGDRITFEQRLGPTLPFPPRNVLVDIHRAFFMRLPLPASGDETVRGILDGERVEEDWKGGHLRERRFARENYRGYVRVRFGEGCMVQLCEPSSFVIDNEWFNYRLQVENKRFVRLPAADTPAP